MRRRVTRRDFLQLSGGGRYAGNAGPSGRNAAEAAARCIVVDMYAKAVQGMAPEDSVKWAHDQLVKIYA